MSLEQAIIRVMESDAVTKYPGDGTLSVVAAMLAVEDTDAHVDDPCGRDCSAIMRDYPGRLERLVIAGALLAAEIDLIRGGGKQ